VGTLERDRFQDQPRLRIRVIDYADAAASPLVARRRSRLAIAIGPRVAEPSLPVVAAEATG
jgi:hypothetical protein